MKFLFKTVCLSILLTPFVALHAASVSVSCSKKSLQSEIGKLDKKVANTVTVSGNCIEDVVVSGHADLTLIGTAGASITATVFDPTPYSYDPGPPEVEDLGGFPLSTTALTVDHSKVTVESLTINGGREGVACTSRSSCVIRNATIQGGWGGIGYQDQSSGDILGSTVIQNSIGVGVGIFGASTVNIRPEPFVDGGVGPVISGHKNPDDDSGGGILLLDGSFLRTDNVTITDNDLGVLAQRDINVKILGGQVSDSKFDGIIVSQGSTAQIFTDLSNNLGAGIVVGPLSFARIASTFSNNGAGPDDDVVCSHVTSISAPAFWCGN